MTLDLSRDGMFQLSREAYDTVTDRENWSLLKWLKRSPAHYLDARKNPQPDTDPKKRGRAVHAAVLEPETYQKKFVVWGDRRAGKEWEKFKAEHEGAGREIITEGMDEAARIISVAVRSHPKAQPYLMAGAGEHSLFWTLTAPAMGATDGYTFRCKGRPDFVSMAPALVDLKTTKDASRDGFGREALRYGYHGQAAWYSDGYHAITGKRLPYVIIAVEPVSPFATTVFRVEADVLEAGRTMYRELLDRLAFCRATNHWPAYETEEVPLELPEWASTEDLADETGLDIGLQIGA